MNKNIIILFFNVILCFAFENSFSQTNQFELNGFIDGLKTGKIALRETLVDQNIKCAQHEILIVNGKFKFKGDILDPTEARFVLNDSLFSSAFFLESGKQQANINIDSLNTPIIIKGSKSNNEYLKHYSLKMEYFQNKIEKWYADKSALENTFHQKVPASINDSMDNIPRYLNRQKDSTLLIYIKAHPTSQVAVWNLHYRVYGQGYLPIYDRAYMLLDKQLKQSNTGIKIKRFLNEGRQTVTGVMFPTINVIDSFGNIKNVFTRSLDKFTLIDFWFSTCLPCIRQFGELRNIYALFESKGFKIMGVSIDRKENEMQWRNAVSKYGLVWPQYWDIGGKEASRLSINTFPSNYLLDNTGRIIAKNLEPFELEKFLKENL